jgi:hypothetical protein
VVEVLSFGTFQSGDFVPTSGGTFTGGVTVPSLASTGAMTGTNLTLSGGVYLGGTGAANYLDDYEKGTWTATLAGSGSNPTVSSYDRNAGYYVKVGNLIYVKCFFEIASGNATGGSGDARITGLPFTAERGNLFLTYVEYTGSYSAGRDALSIRLDDGTNFIRVKQMNYGNMGLNINTDLGLAQFISGLIKIEINGCYIAS